jgi:putative lipoprotein
MLTLAQLDGSRWVASEFAGAANDGRKPTLNFGAPGAAKVSGFGGCNNYFGDARMEGNTLRIGPLAQSMMMCEDAAMKIERTLQQRLDQTRGARRDGPRLVLLDAAGAELMRLDPAP